MHPSNSQSKHINEFHKLLGDLAAIDTAISEEGQALLLLTSLPSSYDNFVETLLYSRDTLKLEDVLTTLNSRELQKMTEAKGNGGEGLYVRMRSGQRDMEQDRYEDNDGYYWEYTPAKGNVLGMQIIKDQSGNTIRVSQSKYYNGKLVRTLLEGHFIMSLVGSLSGDDDVEKNGKWPCIYAVGSQEYQMVCTRLYIASADVGILDKFNRGLQTCVQVFVNFDYAMRRSITVMVRSITSEVYDTYGGCKGG
nr:zinc finger, CCHC-type [Tanacetum cinerariifolium]